MVAQTTIGYLGMGTADHCCHGNSPIRRIEVELWQLSRRERLALAAQVLLDEADVCDQQLAILLNALARDEADSTANPGPDRTANDTVTPLNSSKLSRRRRETLEYLMRGLSEKEVAARMNLTRHTVHQHVKAIYRAMRVHTRSELMSTVFRRSQ